MASQGLQPCLLHHSDVHGALLQRMSAIVGPALSTILTLSFSCFPQSVFLVAGRFSSGLIVVCMEQRGCFLLAGVPISEGSSGWSAVSLLVEILVLL